MLSVVCSSQYLNPSALNEAEEKNRHNFSFLSFLMVSKELSMLQNRSSIFTRNEKLGSPRWSSEGAVACMAPHTQLFEQKRRLPGLVYRLVLQTGQIKMPIYCHTNENDNEVCFL